MYHNARLNFTMSAHISRSLVDQYGCLPTRVECVYAGSNATPVQSGNLSLDRFAQKNILFVGIDWERKGGPVLLEAFREVRRSHPTATLTIVGCAPNVSMPGCRVVGRVPSVEVSKFYETASVFCMPTTVEPFGIVFLEAFAHGVPIVATNIGAIPDFVEQGRSGYMVDCNDAAQLANRLNELLANPARCAAFGVRGQTLVGSRYTWTATAAKLAFHIQRCVESYGAVSQLSRTRAATNADFAARVAL
jgi:glycosyltransferase involved in cell wall biosynthesis